MTRDQKNSMAYDDIVEMNNPSMPEDEEYMSCYYFWRGLAKWPGDDEPYDEIY